MRDDDKPPFHYILPAVINLANNLANLELRENANTIHN